MVRGTRVAANSDIPVTDRTDARARAATDKGAVAVRGGGVGSRLTRRSGGSERIVQSHHVLLVEGSSTQRSHSDVERAVLPEHVVFEFGIRRFPAGTVVGVGSRRKVAIRAADGRGEIGYQDGTVLHAHHAGGLRSRRGAAIDGAG